MGHEGAWTEVEHASSGLALPWLPTLKHCCFSPPQHKGHLAKGKTGGKGRGRKPVVIMIIHSFIHSFFCSTMCLTNVY